MEVPFSRMVLLFLYILTDVARSAAQKPEIRSLHIRSDVVYRFSTTLITSNVVNPYNTSKDALFDVFLPDDAFISNFTMEIDGVVYPGNVKEKEQARKQYERAKKRGQSAGLISKKPREANRFKVSINIAAQGKVTFNLTYQELLQRKKGFYEHTIYVNPGQVVDDMQIEVAVRESREITSVDAMTKVLDNDVYSEYNNQAAGVAIISQPDSESAFIKYFPSRDEQLQYSEDGLEGQFVVRYDIDRELDAGDVLVVNGYFIHFFAPEVQERLPRDVIFIIDASGSMGGRKMEQVKDALRKTLADLLEGERFNIMTFSSGGYDQKWFRDDLKFVTAKNIEKALKFVDSMQATGGTDIHSALMNGIDQLTKNHDSKRALALVFLTDGQANVGVSNTDDILAATKQKNEVGIPMFSLAFGNDADWNLVRKIADENDGFARKIYEDSDASLQIAGFYEEMAVTLMKDIEIKYLDDSVDEESLTRSDYRNYYKGSELVVAGKLDDNKTRHLNLEILGNSIGGNLVLSMSADDSDVMFPDVTGEAKLTDFATITEKTWAYLTIQQLLDKYDITDNITAKEEMKARALDLSLKYNFVTPLTSMVVTKPDVEENAEDSESDNAGSSSSSSGRRGGGGGGRGGGGGGGGGGGYGGGGGGDPHYMIRVRGLEHPICFDLPVTENKIYNVVNDTVNHIVINTEIIASEKLNTHGMPKAFIARIAVITKHHRIIFTPEAILFDLKMYDWDHDKHKHFGGKDLTVFQKSHRSIIRFKFGPEIIIERHLRSTRKNPNVDYFNMYIRNEDEFSRQTNGFLGQFVNGHKHIHMKKQWHADISGKDMAKFQIKTGARHTQHTKEEAKSSRHAFRANLVQRPEMVEKNKELCWMVHSKFYPFLFGDTAQFEVNGLLDISKI